MDEEGDDRASSRVRAGESVLLPVILIRVVQDYDSSGLASSCSSLQSRVLPQSRKVSKIQLRIVCNGPVCQTRIACQPGMRQKYVEAWGKIDAKVYRVAPEY